MNSGFDAKKKVWFRTCRPDLFWGDTTWVLGKKHEIYDSLINYYVPLRHYHCLDHLMEMCKRLLLHSLPQCSFLSRNLTQPTDLCLRPEINEKFKHLLSKIALSERF